MNYGREYDDDNGLSEFRIRQNKAIEIIQAPAVTLLTISIISIVLMVIGLGLELFLKFVVEPQIQDVRIKEQNQSAALVRTAWTLIVIISNIFTLIGSLKMKKMDNRGWSYIACISAMLVPCGPCLILGLPFGIWGLVTMNNPKVSKYFDS